MWSLLPAVRFAGWFPFRMTLLPGPCVGTRVGGGVRTVLAGGVGGLFFCLQKFSKRIFLSVEAVGLRGLCGADVCLCLPSGLGSGRLFFMAPEIVSGKRDKCRGCLGSLVSSKSGAGVRERMRLKILQVFGGLSPSLPAVRIGRCSSALGSGGLFLCLQKIFVKKRQVFRGASSEAVVGAGAALWRSFSSERESL